MPDPWATEGPVTTLREKTLVVQDADGNDLVRLGRLDSSVYGLELLNELGTRIARINGDGLLRFYDASGNAVIGLGKQSDGRYGLTMFDASGNPIIKLGQQSDGTYGLWMFNTSGQAIIKLGQQSDSTFGLWMLDTSGTVKTKVGDVGSGVYDVAVLDPAGSGTFVKLSTLAYGLQAANVLTAETTTSSTWTDLATAGPSVTATIGSSGRALVIAIAGINPGGSDSGEVGISVDGAAPSERCIAYAFSSTQVQTAGARLLSGLSAGSHTFKLQYQSPSNSGAAVLFRDRSIIVIPF